jgi:DNA segregation ATPase FtsK/SpoIIIE, S-DNA-T family
VSVAGLQSDEGPRDLLPGAISSGLIGWLRRFAGLSMLGAAGLGWAGLLSWEAPGSGHATAVSHIAGRVPSALADYLLQSFGIAAAVMFAVPVFWGIEQLARQKLGRPLTRIGLWPASVLMASGALSALPAPSNWPFARGLGGVVGDQLFALVRMMLSPAGQTASCSGAGFLLGIVALILFAICVGSLTTESYEALAVSLGRARGVSLDVDTVAPVVAPLEPDAEPQDTVARQERAAPEPAVRLTPARNGRPPAFSRPAPEPAQRDPAQPIHVPYDDMPDDDESRRMAARFAPTGSRTQAPVEEPAAEPQGGWLGWKDLLGRASDVVAPVAAAPASETSDEAPTAPAATMSASTPAAPARLRPRAVAPYRLPTTTILSRLPASAAPANADDAALLAKAGVLEAVLADFDVRAQIVGAIPGAIVTQYEIQTAAGTKTTRVVSLAEDIAKAMAARSARIAPIPGRTTILIELPNERIEPVALRELLESKVYRQTLHLLPVAAGLAFDRQPIVTDLANVPGLLVAGASGTGKSAALSGMLMSLLLRFAPADLRLLLIDPKGRDLAVFEGIAHLVAPIIREPAHALAALQWCLDEMDERLKTMSRLGMRGIGTYNNAVRNALRQGTSFKRSVQTGFDRETGRAVFEEESITPMAMPYLLLAIDDLDALLEAAGEPAVRMLLRFAQGARSAGFHILATAGRLDGSEVSKVMAAAFPARISFKLASKAESRLVTGDGGAEQLLSGGDFLFTIGGTPIRGQSPTLVDGDAAEVAEWIHSQARPTYEAAIAKPPARPAPKAQPEPAPAT